MRRRKFLKGNHSDSKFAMLQTSNGCSMYCTCCLLEWTGLDCMQHCNCCKTSCGLPLPLSANRKSFLKKTICSSKAILPVLKSFYDF